MTDTKSIFFSLKSLDCNFCKSEAFFIRGKLVELGFSLTILFMTALTSIARKSKDSLKWLYRQSRKLTVNDH